MEEWDLYDKNRIPTGRTVSRREDVTPGSYRCVIHIAIINSDNKMLIQHRNALKKGWADHWDVSVGGHVMSGETSSQGAERELKEELGIEKDFRDIRPSFTVNFETGFDDFYILKMDIDPEELILQEEEVTSVKWAEEDEIFRMIDCGEFIPYHKSLISLIFAMKDQLGVHSRKEIPVSVQQ